MRAREFISPKLNEAMLVTDVPNEEWLNSKIAYAKKSGRNSFGVPYMGSTTGYVRNPSQVELPVSLLAQLPGARNEQQNVRTKDLEAIVKIMQDTGRLPLWNGREYKPFIGVAWNGEPWVLEGNHRIMAAAKLGWKTLPVELKYFDGGERVETGVLHPDRIGLTHPKPGEPVIMNEFAPGAGGDRGNYLLALASAWYTHDLGMLKDIINQGGSPMRRIINAQEAVEQILQRGIHCADGRVRKYNIDYNPGFDGVIVFSDDYYEHTDTDDAGRDVDGRTGRPWGPYEFVEFSDAQLGGGIGEGVAEGSDNLNYIGNCTDDDVIEHIFGDATNFAQAVEEHGNEFTIGDLVVKYDPEADVHSFYYKKPGVAEGVNISQEWMSDTELDQYVPDELEQEWRELVGYDREGNIHPLWANMTGNYEPDVNDPQHRRWMVSVANKWFAMKKIPNVKFYDVKDINDELEWLVQIGGEQGVAEGKDTVTYQQQKGKNKFSIEMLINGNPAGVFQYDAGSGRTIAELDPEYRGRGLGQRLILKGIYTAAVLGMNYVEDESRTEMFDRAMDSLADAGYIVNDNDNWYVTDQGERFLKQDLTEAFNQPYKLKWEKSDYGDYDALAKLDDGTHLSIMFNNEYKKNWMVEFYRNNSQQVTGEGDAQRIFATVLHAIGQFIKKKKPTSIFFSAVKEDDPTGSRAKLYDRLVQRYAGSLGYTVRKQEQPGSMSFKLVRNQEVEENFADGRKPGRKGLARRVGVDCKQPVSKLRKIASNSSGERQRMAHWCANMKSGRKK